MANKIRRGTRTQCSTFGTQLGSIMRCNSLDNNTYSFSFILDERLKLIETPVANPIIHSLSTSLLSDTFKVFHYNLVSIEIGNNVFTDIMVCPSHELVFPTTKLDEKSLSLSCAFGLKFTTQIFEFPFSLLDFSRIIKPAVRTDGEVIYSEVNAKNSILDIRTFGSNLFRECKQEITSTFFINPEQTFSYFPTEIVFITVRDTEWNLNSTFDGCNTQNIIFEGCRPREVISHGASVDNGFRLSFLDHSTRLFYASDCELRLQSVRPQCFINQRLKFDIVLDFVFPSCINTELQTFSIDVESFNYLGSSNNLNFSCCSDVHDIENTVDIYKTYGGGVSIPPTIKIVGFFETTS